MIGLSLSLCVLDVIENKLDPKSIERIVTGTAYPGVPRRTPAYPSRDEFVRGINSTYCRTYRKKNPSRAFCLALDLWDQGKLDQPRTRGEEPPYPSTSSGQARQGHWSPPRDGERPVQPLKEQPAMAVHFVGFPRSTRLYRGGRPSLATAAEAQRRASAEIVFGPPAFVHDEWDRRAYEDYDPTTDIMVIACPVDIRHLPKRQLPKRGDTTPIASSTPITVTVTTTS